MTMYHHHATGSFADLATRLDRYAEAGIDPAFDAEMEELERQFAELRFAFCE